jgi:uncharacterized OB-fold protein
MSAGATTYPQAAPDADNRAMLEAWRAGRLALQACAQCGARIFYPRPICPHCWSDRLDWVDAAGRGEVLSFSLIHRPNDPAFFAEAPIVLAEIRLAEGVALLARVIGADPEALAIGTVVELLPLPEANRYPLPTFRPAAV